MSSKRKASVQRAPTNKTSLSFPRFHREGDVGQRATCTTCQMAEDFSNYWVAHMYFKDPKNGSYQRVMPSPVQPLLGGSNGAKGGLTVYYTQFDLNRDNLKQQPIKAFPPVSLFSLFLSLPLSLRLLVGGL